MKGPPTLSPVAREAAVLLGNQVRLARRARGWTLAELATRVGVTPVTIRKVETGDPTVALGTALEAAALSGVTLFHPEAAQRSRESDQIAARLALLPRRVTRRPPPDDNF